ncbi:hypothetical protein FACS1894122_08910 [Alphaproteobacteria bacterium]|nr:hypothetical protein FACS1894122_08910 [Alphaproteobacteria bacterium]
MYKLNENEIFCDVADGIAVAINSKTGIYYGLNRFGTAVFELLIKGHSTPNVLNALKKIPNIPMDIEKNLHDFINVLLDTDMLLSTDSQTSEEIRLDANIAVADGFALTIDEYADAKELLLADPIHDVEEETGWQPVLKIS